MIQELNASLLPSLPKEEKGQVLPRYQYKGFWYSHKFLLGMLVCQKYFKARDSDVLLATLPKSGTTWLKALSFSIINRATYPRAQQNHPLLTSNPHELVPFLELNLYADNRISHLCSSAPARALISTHLPYSALPHSIQDSRCKIVYICRDPADVLVSHWHFVSRIKEYKSQASQSLEDAFESFCAGTFICGPYWDHVLEYWKASLENPEKVLFLKYEDLKRNAASQLKRLAEFLGHPFTPEEDDEGAIEDILRLCSFENLSNQEANKAGKTTDFGKLPVECNLFFRRGEVGDSANHLTPRMMQRLDRIIKQKFQGSGLTFGMSGWR